MHRTRYALHLAVAAALFAAPLTASAATLDGKVVDLGTYLTHDHNMDAMHGHAAMANHTAMAGHDAMAGHTAMAGHDAMAGHTAMAGHDAMAGHTAMAAHDAMGAACPTLGLVTNAGGTYLLVTQMGSSTSAALCKKVGQSVHLDGTAYSQNGMRAFLVAGAK